MKVLISRTKRRLTSELSCQAMPWKKNVRVADKASHCRYGEEDFSGNFEDPDRAPDPTEFLSKETKAKFCNKTAA